MKKRTAQSIGELLDRLFQSPNVAAKLAEGSLPDIWRQVVGPVVAEQTRQVRLVKGILFVHITSAVMRTELMMQRDALTAAINARCGMAIVKSLVVQ